MRFQHLKRWRITAEDVAFNPRTVRSSLLTFKSDMAGDCQAPVYREYHGAEAMKARLDGTGAKSRGPQSVIEFDVRCRKCANCLKARAHHWRLRASAEISQAARTWFGTLTFRPEEVYRHKCAAHLRLAARGIAWAEMSSDDQFAALAHEMGKEFTLFMKRLRKAGASVRYCLVAEAHKSGVPHFHVLIHERAEEEPVRHKVLVDQWRAGFCKFNLCNDRRPASYVTKYLTKSARARIRASAHYGSAVVVLRHSEA